MPASGREEMTYHVVMIKLAHEGCFCQQLLAVCWGVLCKQSLNRNKVPRNAKLLLLLQNTLHMDMDVDEHVDVDEDFGTRQLTPCGLHQRLPFQVV